LALPFRPVTAGDFTSSLLGQKTGVCVMPGAHHTTSELVV
jgi:hypothetical protein